ncbi:MAG: glycosyltransferase [Verrucomicrobia bacterium]|nr:glycosyltransferase [Verrucomicrobiota bacterium]
MQRRIRVLHLIDNLDLGGAQTVLLAWLRYQDRTKFDVHLASIHGTRKSLFYARARDLGTPIVLLSPRRWLPLYLLRLPVEISANGYDIVHCHLLASNWLGKLLARILRTPVVISHDHCIDPLRANSTIATFIDRQINRLADEVLAVSPGIRNHLIAAEGIASERIQVIPNCVPELPLGERKRASGKLIGGAGRLVPQKNFLRFLRIACRLVEIDQSYQFVIAGQGPQETTLKNEAARLGLNIHWLGVQPALDQFFSEIDFFLLTSDFEGCPMALLEALFYGVPAAAMMVEGIRGEFSDELLLLDPGESDNDLARHIHARLENQAEVNAQVQRGKEIVARRFSARKQIRTIEEIYVSLLERT